MADAPQFLTLKRNRDLEGLEKRPWTRRVLLALLALFVLAGAVNAFGQRPSTDVADVAAARFEVYSPPRVRSGLYFMSRFTIDAKEDLAEATIVLEPGWLEGITLNTVEPAPVGEASRDGNVALQLGHVPADGRHVLYLHFQVNPTEVGRRSQDALLYDGERLLARIDRTITIFP
ncbi:MAG TPA: hypothetical protein VK874_10080 [Gaiellaceae bacterium]|nr:hypothetical protein [Gaiellaceae bacterium]